MSKEYVPALPNEKPQPSLPKLFVSGVQLDISELELAKLMALYSDIAALKIVRDKKNACVQRVCLCGDAHP